ncbi:hypothetical protein GCM10027037_33790 [Mucilaginibacter koreensis]
MSKLPILKASAFVILALGTLCSHAQDSTKAKPTRTPAKTMVVNPKLQRGTIGPVATPAAQPRTITPAKPATSTQPASYRRPAASIYRQPGAANTAGAAVNMVADKSLSSQYQYLLTKVYGYQRPVIAAFYKNITDSLTNQKRKVKQLQASLNSQTKTVKDLQSDVSSKEESLNESNSKADAISLLGIKMSKSAYNTLMWGLVLVFGATAAVVIMQSGSNRREAKYRTKLYDDLDNEYKTYKVKANEKEKKLARDLQTARNKLEEITGNPEY